MKRNFLFFSLLFVMSFLVSISSLQAKVAQGIAYYNAGFSQVAKPLLLAEMAVDSATLAETCYYLGNIYFEENKPDSASIYFNKGLMVYPLNSLNAVGLTMLKMKSNLSEAELEIKNILKLKANKKNVVIMVSIAKAYLVNGLIDQAIIYQELSKNIKSKSAAVSVLLGDIELAKGSIGNACQNYELAILYDDACKEAYIKYARAYKNVNTPLAIEKLGVLKQKEPTFLLVDRELADIYYATNKFDKAAELYENYLQSGNSNAQDLTKYAMTLFLNNDFAKSLEVATLGLQKAPRSPAFNRLAMWNNVDLKKYNDAIKAADLFFNKSDKPDINYLDYRYYGQALRETKQFDLAIPQYQKALTMDSSKVELWKDISDMYNEKSDYNNAISAYMSYMQSLSADKKTADVLMPLGKLYYNFANNPATDVLLKKGAFLKADSIFGLVATLEPNGYRANYWRARANSALDPETTQGLSKPYYEQTVTLLESKVDPRYNSILIECYSYLGYYALLQKDNVLSLTYWAKILVIDPANATALKATEGITKAMKGKK